MEGAPRPYSPRSHPEPSFDACTPATGAKVEDLARHKKRLAVIKRGDVPGPGMYKVKEPVPLATQSPPKRTTGSRPQTAPAKKTMHRVLPKFDPKEILPLKPGEVEPSDQMLLENSRAIKKSIVNDLQMLKIKGDAFRRDASHFEKRRQNPMHMMNLFYDNKERASGELSNVMIDGERFEYSDKFRAATESASSVKKELAAVYKKCF